MTRYYISLLFMASAAMLHAQDYEADSVYYTAIDRTKPATVERKVAIFRDTTSDRKAIAYYFDVSLGMLTGCQDCVSGREFTFSTSTTHGMTLGRKTRLGAGVGFDSYHGWNVVPLFGSVSYDLLGTKNTHAVFVQGQYGWSMAWHTLQPFEPTPVDEKGGVVFSALLGYRMRYQSLRIAVSAGYKRQSASLLYETQTWIPTDTGWTTGTPSRTQMDLELGRAVVNLSISWK